MLQIDFSCVLLCTAAVSCHSVSSKQELESSSRKWKLMQCENTYTGVHKAVLNALHNIIDTDGTIKKADVWRLT